MVLFGLARIGLACIVLVERFDGCYESFFDLAFRSLSSFVFVEFALHKFGEVGEELFAGDFSLIQDIAVDDFDCYLWAFGFVSLAANLRLGSCC